MAVGTLIALATLDEFSLGKHRANLLMEVADRSEVMSLGIWLRNLSSSQRSSRQKKRNRSVIPIPG